MLVRSLIIKIDFKMHLRDIFLASIECENLLIGLSHKLNANAKDHSAFLS